jgi:hypothetical protein
MGKLHELLAVEKTKVNASNKLLQDTLHKFKKPEYFSGHVKSLKMIEDSEQNRAIQDSAYDFRNLPTTVVETLEYAFKFWADSENVLYQKNKTNQYAMADLMYNGTVVAKDVPVDELLGLETRLQTLRGILDEMPTLTAAVKWTNDFDSNRRGAWMAVNPEVTTKTERTTVPVVLYDATDKHPAQVKESTVDRTVGTFMLQKYSGAATSAEKAKAINIVDNLLAEVKQARMRANSVEANTDTIGEKLVDIIMGVFN